MSDRGIISAGTRIVGKISAEGALDVHGHVEGSIEANADVHIADDARIKSSVHGQRVVVSGAVAGDLSASDTLVLEPSARVVGDLAAPTIGIRPGALLRGRVETGNAEPVRSTARAASASSRTVVASEKRTVASTTRANTSKSTARTKKAAAKPRKAATSAKKKPPAPVMPKASGRAKKASTKTKRAAAKPKMVAAGKRAKKAGSRRKKAR